MVSLQQGGTVTLDRATFTGSGKAISAFSSGTNISLLNVLIYGTSGIALDLTGARGEVAFSTVTASGLATTTGPRLVVCNDNILFRSSILWDSLATASRPALTGGCRFQDTIVGSIAIAGAASGDPQFVDPENSNFRLSSTSPAVDASNEGPVLDFEGDGRPSGGRFDVGADEFVAP